MKTDISKNLKDRRHHKLIKRKISIGILTALIVLTAMLAPFSIKVDSNKIDLQSSVVHAQIGSGAGAGATGDQNDMTAKILSEEFTCNITPLGAGNFTGCIVQGFFYIWYYPTSWLLGWSAELFNSLAAITLSSALYNASSFISDAWVIVRDFSNILFIFVLIYAASAIVLDLQVGGGSPKKVLTWVIIMAILVNFSMFFTKVVIDSTNVLALIFYNKIGATDAHGYTPLTDPSMPGIVAQRDVAGEVAAGFHPQALANPDFYNLLRTPPSLSIGVFTVSNDASVPASTMIVMLLITGMIFLYAAYAFFIAAISFMGRMVQLWVSIIFSPFAFVSYIVPAFSSLPGLGFAAWSSTLVSAAISAPIFLFFIYLISLLTKSNFISLFTTRNLDGFSNLTSVQAVLLVAIPLLIIMKLLLEATGYARKAGGEITNAIFGGLKSVAGVGIAGASIATGFLGRATIGRGAAALGESEWLKEKGKSAWSLTKNPLGGAVARFGLKTFETVGKKSMDIRGTGAGKVAAGFAGIKLGEIGGAGGWIGRREAAMKKDLEAAERIKTTKTDRELEDTWPENIRLKKEYQAKQKAYDDEFGREKELEKQRATSQGLVFDEAKWKTKYDDEKKRKKEYAELKLKTADDINKERTAALAQTFKTGTVVTKAAGLVTPMREAELAASKKLAPELSTAQSEKYEKDLSSWKTALDRSNKRLEQIRDELKKFEEITKGKNPEEITKHIEEAAADHKVALVDIESQIKTFENNYKNETDAQKKKDIGDALKEAYLAKQKKEKELKDTGNMLGNYKKNQEEEKKVADRTESIRTKVKEIETKINPLSGSKKESSGDEKKK